MGRSSADRLAQTLGKRGGFDSPEQAAYLALCRTASELAGPLDALLDEYGLSQATYNVLRIVRGHGERGLPSQRIAPLMVARVPDVTRLVDRLCRSGLVSRVRCAEDRRIVYVRLTSQGSALLRSLDPKVLDVHRAQFDGVSRKDLSSLLHMLERVRERAASV